MIQQKPVKKYDSPKNCNEWNKSTTEPIWMKKVRDMCKEEKEERVRQLNELKSYAEMEHYPFFGNFVHIKSTTTEDFNSFFNEWSPNFKWETLLNYHRSELKLNGIFCTFYVVLYCCIFYVVLYYVIQNILMDMVQENQLNY